MVNSLKVLSVLLPVFLMEIVATSLYWETEMQIQPGGRATTVTNLFAILTITTFITSLPICYLARNRISQSFAVNGIMLGLITFASGGYISALIAFFQRFYTGITALYIPVLILTHLNLIPITYWLCLAIYHLCRFPLRIFRRLYLQEDIRQRKLEIDLKLLKRFEIENQLKSEINDIQLSQKELEYQTYLATIKLKAQQVLSTQKRHFQIIDDLCNDKGSSESKMDQVDEGRNQVDEGRNQVDEGRNQVVIHVGPVAMNPVKLNSEICSICYERKVTHAIVSCGHPICGDAYCHDMLRDRCHICRQPCEKIIRVYFALNAK